MAVLEASRRPSQGRSSYRAEAVSLVGRLDLVLLFVTLALIGYGLWAVAGVTRFDIAGDEHRFVVRQGIAAAVGLVGLVVATIIPPRFWRRSWPYVYLGTIAMMVFTFAFAEVIRGSRRWIEVGPIQFQPSEFGKALFALALAGFLADHAARLRELRTVIAAIVLACVPMVLVFLQPDLGTALVYAAALAAALFVAGVRWGHVVTLLVGAIGTVTSVLWLLPAAGIQVLKPYQIDRLTGFMNPEFDPAGLTYNVNQSITAIGAGGLDGRGVSEASQTRFDYLPEHATDFVFASFAEQRGFLGASVLLLLYLLVIWRGLRVVTLASDFFGAIVAGAITFAFLFQVFINVGMTMGVAPVTGIPLPYMTVGGSSMVANLLAVGLLQAIHARGGAFAERS